MTVTSKPLAEITAQAIRVLCREIGAVNTARFLNQFSTGTGNYTKERDQLLGEPTVADLISELRGPQKGRRSKLTTKGTTRAKQ